MLRNPTAEKLRDMRLKTMADSFINPEPGIEALSFEDRFALMVEREWHAKKDSRITRLKSNAGFEMQASLEDVDYRKGRNISRKDVATLGSCVFIQQKLNIIISGKTGSGKSYLACAIGDTACHHNYSVKYYRQSVLFEEIAMARLENRYGRFMGSLKKIHLLILDDLAMKSYSHEEARDLLEIAELRYNRLSTIFASQVPHDKWYDLIPDPTIADAFMDRIVHNAYIVPLDSNISMREIMAQKRMKALDMLNQDG